MAGQEREHWAVRIPEALGADSPPTEHPLWALFLVSVVALYVEIMLIRWVGTEVRIFAYFQNLALIACFLGFGLGCYWSRQRKNLYVSLIAMTILVAMVKVPSAMWQTLLITLSTTLSLSPDADLWGSGRLPHGLTYVSLFAVSVLTVAIFLALVVIAMVPFGQWVGYYLDEARHPIRAYGVNLLGSVVGLWFFALLAYLWYPPSFWFGAAFLLLWLLRGVRRRPALLAPYLLLLVWVFLFLHRFPEATTYWSPYQKLDITDQGDSNYYVAVNNTGYMEITNMTPQFLSRFPGAASYIHTHSSYDSPYRFARGVDRVLILGAGAGNDAAAALRNGAQHVDAVEIDPVIGYLGTILHAERPYSSSQVHLVLTDARAFLRQPHPPYDVIMFGLLDSHTQFSDYSNMRIDNYVYTEQSFREAHRLLKPDGILVVKFEVRPPWLWMGQRFYALLDQVFGRPPVVYYAAPMLNLVSATVFIDSNDPSLWQRAAEPPLAQIVQSSPPPFALNLSAAPPLTTDDWPYVYHRGHTVPRTFLTVSLILLAMAMLFVRDTLRPGQAQTWFFFFLGAGFLLLETQMVSRLALYFGTTWMVNCIALTVILMVLVLATMYVARFRPRRLVFCYLVLVILLVADYWFPWGRLPYSAHTVGLLLSIAYAVPVFFAGVIFTEMFARQAQKSEVLGANLVGAVAGGLSQNLSFIAGTKILLIVAAAFYVVAGLFRLFPGATKIIAKEGVPVGNHVG